MSWLTAPALELLHRNSLTLTRPHQQTQGAGRPAAALAAVNAVWAAAQQLCQLFVGASQTMRQVTQMLRQLHRLR